MAGGKLDFVSFIKGRMNKSIDERLLPEGEYVDENSSLDFAIYQIVTGGHLALMVTKGKKIVGILRMADVFAAVFHVMKESEIKNK